MKVSELPVAIDADAVTVDARCSDGMSDAAAVPQEVPGAALLSRGLIEQRRQARGALTRTRFIALASAVVRGSIDCA